MTLFSKSVKVAKYFGYFLIPLFLDQKWSYIPIFRHIAPKLRSLLDKMYCGQPLWRRLYYCIEKLVYSAIANSLLKPISFCLALCNYKNTNFKKKGEVKQISFFKKKWKVQEYFCTIFNFCCLRPTKRKNMNKEPIEGLSYF